MFILKEFNFDLNNTKMVEALLKGNSVLIQQMQKNF